MSSEPKKPSQISTKAVGIAVVGLILGFAGGFACHGEYQRLGIGYVMGLNNSESGYGEHIGLTTVRTFYFTLATNGFWEMDSEFNKEHRNGKVTFRSGNTAQIRISATNKGYENDYRSNFNVTLRVKDRPLNSVVIDRDLLQEFGKAGKFCARIESRSNVGFIEVTGYDGMDSEDAIEFMVP